MIEVILSALAVILFVVMARKAKGHYKRRSVRSGLGKYVPGDIGLDRSLGTLAAKTGVETTTTTVDEVARVSSVKCTYTLSDFTQIGNAGPILVCIAHSDYSLAEIEAWVERVTSWSSGDLIAQEVSNRRIRKIGIFPGVPSDNTSVTLNDGKPIKTKLNWRLNTGQGLKFFLYNLGTGALATTDPNVNIQGKANLWFR